MALRRSTIATASTLTDLQYQMVLDNIGNGPRYARCASVARKIKPRIRFYRRFRESLSFSIIWPLGSRAAGLNGTRGWNESWTIVPVVDHSEMQKLRRTYEKAANEPWIQRRKPTETEVPEGTYKTEIAWVKKSDIGKLSELVLEIMNPLQSNPVSELFCFLAHQFGEIRISVTICGSNFN
jgi:hypothetical protein